MSIRHDDLNMDWRAAKPGHETTQPTESRAWDYPLTWPVLAELAVAVACIVALSVAGWLV